MISIDLREDISVEKAGTEPLLTFTDDGYGMTIDVLHKMLSFGYCEKVYLIFYFCLADRSHFFFLLGRNCWP